MGQKDCVGVASGVLTVEDAWHHCDIKGVAEVALADPLCSRVKNCSGALLTAGYPSLRARGPGRFEP